MAVSINMLTDSLRDTNYNLLVFDKNDNLITYFPDQEMMDDNLQKYVDSELPIIFTHTPDSTINSMLMNYAVANCYTFIVIIKHHYSYKVYSNKANDVKSVDQLLKVYVDN